MSWIIIRTPLGVHVWEADIDLVDAARVAAGFPVGDAWALDDGEWDLAVDPGDDPPHPSLLAGALVVGTADDLRAVDPKALEAHKLECLRVRRQTQIDSVKAAYAALDEEGKAAVLADMAVVESDTRG